ncbi:MAG: hypothetical protein RI949_849, partial [Pseudomonadota bacterium]
EIERLAAQELRSTNAQVEYLLRQALLQQGRRRVESVTAGQPYRDSNTRGPRRA